MNNDCNNSSPSSHEPVAIIGMGCRFPGGASSPKAFWDLLLNGIDAIIDVPTDRWDIRRFYDPNPDRPGKTYAKQGGFLQEKIDEFDPLFFGISPREAATLDPQQRLLLEVTWEAIEDAGLVIENLAGSKTGVFVGGFCLDNKLQQFSILNRELVNSHTSTSGTMTILANRLSYVFDLRGPSVTVDTACSSSLVAVHFACQSLWAGESNLAIVGGVNVMLGPEYPIAMCKSRFLSPHARCMAFDERAAGYVRGEGAGVLIFKPLSQALKDNDPIYALIRATGSNQDGHTAGISFPNSEAQAALIQDVHHRAKISPKEVGYIEAHGTGTQAGDFAEAMALHKVLSVGREPQDKCLVGSLKTNIGHLEAAAGIAGLMKAALVLKQKQIPQSLHFETPNPKIPFDELCIRVATKLEMWPEEKPVAYAGVNSFGYGGTNAHVLLQEAPVRDIPARTPEFDRDHPLLIPLSAHSESALKALVKKYRDVLFNTERPDILLADLAYTTTLRRSHHTHRLGMVVSSRQQLKEYMHSFLVGEKQPSLFYAANEQAQKVLFVYTGMGPQWWGMGRELMRSEPVFRQTLEACDAIFLQMTGWSLIEALSADEQESRIGQTQIAQPTNFALQVALTALWNSWGIQPDAVVGHSVGEVAAAYVSGALSLSDALLVSYHRSRLQQTVAGQGTMLAAGLSELEVERLIANYDNVSIAAVNSPASVTLAGQVTVLQEIAAFLTESGIFNRLLQVEVAYHSYQMDPLREELLSSLASLQPRQARIPLYSTVTGQQLNGDDVGASYWWQNVRQPVQLAKAITGIIDESYRIFLEVGPHPVLAYSIKECLREAGATGQLVSSLHRKKPELSNMLTSLAHLYTLGLAVNWENVAPQNARYVPLPTYPWQRERYWSESAPSRQYRLGQPGHVFLNNDLNLPHPAWEVELNTQFLPYLNDHRIEETVVFPGAAYTEAGLALHKKVFDRQTCVLEDVTFHQLLVLNESQIQMLHLTYQPQTKRYSVYSRPKEDGAEWTVHATGRILSGTVNDAAQIELSTLQNTCSQELSVQEFYQRLDQCGLNYGPHFRTIRQIWRGSEGVLVKIEKDRALVNDEYEEQYLLHPTLLDGAFQAFVASIEEDNPTPYVPVSIERVTFHASPKAGCWGYSKVIQRDERSMQGDILLFDEDGCLLVEIQGLTCQAIAQDKASSGDLFDQWLYEFSWQPAPVIEWPVNVTNTSDWLIFSNHREFDGELVEALRARGIHCTIVSCGEVHKQITTDHYQIRWGEASDMRQLLADTQQKSFDTILYLWSLKENHNQTMPTMTEIVDHSMSVIHLIQALAERLTINQTINLGIVTRGTQLVTSDEVGSSLTTAPLWGLGRLIGNEHANIQCKLVDLPPVATQHEMTALLAEFLSGNQDEDVAFRDGKRFVKRLMHAPTILDEQESETELVSTDHLVELAITHPGQIDKLVYRERNRRKPERGEIEVRVHSTALNFKDVLKVLGQISDKVLADTYFGNSLGMELSGTVVAVGEGVNEFKMGDEVMALHPGSFCSYAIIPTAYVIPKPKRWRFEQAPIIAGYLTAYYGLVEVAGLRKGERILIHSATGGVGLAAIQVAKWIGAEIFATAGSEQKRRFLREQGIQHIFDSRSLAFADQIKKLTDGRGVDVVINAIAGEALYKSFALLAPYGRFIEIGKKDIAENNGLPMRAFNRNLIFAAIDIDRLLQERKEDSRRILRKIAQLFKEGHFQPMAVKTFPATKVKNAFRFMAQSRHIGKIVVTMQDQKVLALPNRRQSAHLHEEGTVLITGGTRGLGLAIANWLSEKGVRQLALISRRGATSDEAKQAIRDMEARGTHVLAAAVDVSDETQVAQLMRQINASQSPLRGIFHCAMVLEDAFLIDLKRSSFERVMAPKVAGVLNLHRQVQNQPLDFFISFSSTSALIGNVGQSSYVAANTFLDLFAHYQRARGIPATAINLGVVSDVGVVSRKSDIKELFERGGIKGLSMQQVLQVLEHIIKQNPSQIGLFDVKWDLLFKAWPNMSKSSRYQRLLGDNEKKSQTIHSSGQYVLIHDLSSLEQGERQALIQSHVGQVLSQVLQLPAARIDLHQKIDRLGVDSLMMLELRQGLKAKFGLDVPLTSLLHGPTVAQVAQQILQTLEASH